MSADTPSKPQNRTQVQPGQSPGKAPAPGRSQASELASFLEAAKTLNPEGSGRLVFSLDATMSRQPTWDRACEIQASMFDAVAKIGSLSVQLVYFRGFGECRASKWVVNARALRDLMTTITCAGGKTQIGKVLKHADREASAKKLSALVYIGDAMEEDADALCHAAGVLALKGTKAFMFLEGNDPDAERTFREIARLTGGAFFRLGPNSAKDLAELLGAIAVYASGGRIALEARGGRGERLLLEQMPRSGRDRGPGGRKGG
ncbi:MAG: VWA domain-containing protein [Nitratireductor sp.]|jgi:hypothetical protein|nr:VWA domain-containing protein [Nitratireductor sp.]